MIALQSMQSFALNGPPQESGEQRHDRPQRHGAPAVAARFRAPDGGDRFRRQHDAVAGGGSDLVGDAGGAAEEGGSLPEEAPDLAGALGGVLQPAGRPEIALDPFAHHRLGGGAYTLPSKHAF